MDKTTTHILLIKSSFVLLTIYFFFALTNFSGIIFRSNYFLAFCLLLTLIGFILSPTFHWTRITILSVIAVIIIGIIAVYKAFSIDVHVNNDYTLFYVVFFCMAMGDIDIRNLFKLSFFTQLILTVVTMLFFILHLLPNSTLTRGDTIRQSLGFAHPNLLGLVIFCLTVEFLYIYFKKIDWLSWIIVLLFNSFIYYITLSRTSFICSLAILFVFLIERNTRLFHHVYVRKAMLSLIPVLFIISVVLPYAYSNNGFYITLNKLLSNRLSQGNYYLEKFGVHLFGRPIPDTIKVINPSNNWIEGWVVDSSYLRILIQYGLIVFLAMFVIVFLKSMNFTKKGYLFELTMVLICLFYGFFERYSYNAFIYTTPFILLLDTSKPKMWQWEKMRFKSLTFNKMRKGV